MKALPVDAMYNADWIPRQSTNNQKAGAPAAYRVAPFIVALDDQVRA